MADRGTSTKLSEHLALRGKITVAEAARLNAVSVDTFRRTYPHLIKQVSPKRGAVVLGDALGIGEAKKAKAT